MMTRWKAIGWTVAFFVSGIALLVGVNIALVRLFPTVDRLVAGVVSQIVGFGIATYGIAGPGLKWSWKDLRYTGVGSPGRGFGVGLLLGVIPAALVMAVALPAGGARWSLDGGTVVEWGRSVGTLALLLLPAAYSEELMFRGLGIVVLRRGLGMVPAVIISSILFGAAHLGNPNVSALGIMNVALAGVWLSAAFWLPGGIWTATGAHVGWNLALAALGAPVSGMAFTLPMLDYATGGPDWLTGGAFGPEGGVIATVVVGAATVLLFRMTKQDSRPTTQDS